MKLVIRSLGDNAIIRYLEAGRMIKTGQGPVELSVIVEISAKIYYFVFLNYTRIMLIIEASRGAGVLGSIPTRGNEILI